MKLRALALVVGFLVVLSGVWLVAESERAQPTSLWVRDDTYDVRGSGTMYISLIPGGRAATNSAIWSSHSRLVCVVDEPTLLRRIAVKFAVAQTIDAEPTPYELTNDVVESSGFVWRRIDRIGSSSGSKGSVDR